MPGILSENVTKLCLKLGFSDQSPGGDQKSLAASITKFRSRREKQGQKLLDYKQVSQHALNLAEDFCKEEDRGANLWPERSQGLSWLEDEETIIELVAHIFTLQSYYRDNREKRKLKNQLDSSRQSPEAISVHAESLGELSAQLETMPQYPTSSTAGLNLGPNTVPIMTDLMDNVSPLKEACENEVRSLDPRLDDQPLLDFTVQWISQGDGLWPPKADIRLKTWMYEQQIYDSECPKMKAGPLIERLLDKTELQNQDQKSKNIFLRRIHDRMDILKKEGCTKGILEMNCDGNIQMNTIFNSHWRNRHGKWGPKTSPLKNKQTQQNQDVYDTPVDECEVSSASRVVESLGDLDDNTHRAKRQKHSRRIPNAKKPIIIPARSHRTTTATVMEEGVTVTSIDSENDEDNATSSKNHYYSSTNAEKRKFSSDTPLPEYPTAINKELSAPSKDLASVSIPVASRTPSLVTKFIAATQIHQPIQLVFKPRKYVEDDMDPQKFITWEEIAGFSLAKFTSTYSQKFDVSIDSLRQISFQRLFGRGEPQIIQNGDEKMWRSFKFLTDEIFRVVMAECLEEREYFTIVVSNGDSKRKASQGLDF